MIQRITWDDLKKSGNPLSSPCVKSNGHVFTSGNIGFDTEGNLSDDVSEQTETAIKNLENVLITSGSSSDKVLKVLLFIGDASYATEVSKIYAKYFVCKPDRSCVIVAFPNPEIKIELECVAEYQDRFDVMMRMFIIL